MNAQMKDRPAVWSRSRLLALALCGIALSVFVERRRSREHRLLHEACVAIVAASVVAARAALAAAPPEQRALRLRRLRGLEELHAYATGAT